MDVAKSSEGFARNVIFFDGTTRNHNSFDDGRQSYIIYLE
jgi:hypothetical protein